jgi:hypothetical protein
MAEDLSRRALAMVTTTSHHEHWSRVTFKVRGEEWRFCSDSLRIEIAR